MKKVLMVMVDVDKVIRPANIPPITQVTILYCCVYLFLIYMLTKVCMVIKEVILVLIVEDVYLCLNTTYIIPFKITEKLLVVMGEVDIGIITYPISIIIQVVLEYFWVYMLLVMV